MKPRKIWSKYRGKSAVAKKKEPERDHALTPQILSLLCEDPVSKSEKL